MMKNKAAERDMLKGFDMYHKKKAWRSVEAMEAFKAGYVQGFLFAKIEDGDDV